MKKILLPYVLFPALGLAVVTVARAYFEVQSPDSFLRPLLSTVVLSLIWTLVAPSLMLRNGVSLGTALIGATLFFVLQRLPIGTVYGLAAASEWTIAGTDQPVRYRVDGKGELIADSAMTQFLGNTFAPVLPGVVIFFLVWSIAWVIGFRGKRPYAGAAVD